MRRLVLVHQKSLRGPADTRRSPEGVRNPRHFVAPETDRLHRFAGGEPLSMPNSRVRAVR
jgi:hypothetical protein